MGQLRSILKITLLVCIILFYGYWALIYLGFQLLWNRRKYFNVKKRENPPECLLDKSLGVHQFIEVKGVKIHYVSAGDTEKPLMVMIHGFPEFWYSWRHCIKELSKDYWVVALDMRGFGESGKPAGVENYKAEIVIEDVKCLIESLNRSNAIIVAHDWGGIIAWKFAEQFPGMVDKLIILNAPHPEDWNRRVNGNWKQFLMSWYVFFFQIPILPEIILSGNDFRMFDKLCRVDKDWKETTEAYKYVYSKPGALSSAVNYYRANFAKRPLEKKSTRIKNPTLVIWGKKDAYLDERLANDASKHVEGTFQLQLIEDGNHFIQLHRPQLVNKYIKEFLSSND